MNLQAFHHPNNDNSWLTFVCLIPILYPSLVIVKQTPDII